MAEIASAFVSILPSMKGFGTKLQAEAGAEADKSGKSVGRRFGTAMKVGALAVAGAAVGAGVFLKGAVDAASDLAESQSKVGVVFGKSAGQIMAASKTSATAMGLSKQAYLEATGTFGNLLVSLDLGPQKAAKMSQQMVSLAGDLASFNNVSPEEALDALKSGLTGETEPLKKFGVNMNDATLKAEALKLGLVKNTKEALTPQNKALAAQSLIMSQTKTAQGDFARTSGGLANQQRILSAQFANSKASLGKIFLPLVVKAVTLINKGFGSIGPTIERVKTSFANFTGGSGMNNLIATLQAKLMPVLRTIATTFMTVVLPALQRFGAFVIANVLPVVQQMVGIFVTQVLPVLSRIALFIYGQLVPALVKIVTQIAGSLRPVFEALFAQLSTTVLPIVAKLLEKFREWWPTISRVIMIVLRVIGVVLRLAAAILGKVLPPLIRFAGFLIRTVVSAIVGVIDVVVKIIGKLTDFGKWVVDGGKKIGDFAGKVKTAIGDAIEYVKDLPQKAKDALGDLKDTLVEKGEDLVRGIWEGIKAMGKWLKDHIIEWVKDHIPGPIADILGISSPSKVMAEQARWIPIGMAKGIDDAAPTVDAAMSRIARRISVPRVGIDSTVGATAGGRAGLGNTWNIYEARNPSSTAREVERHLAFAGGS